MSVAATVKQAETLKVGIPVNCQNVFQTILAKSEIKRNGSREEEEEREQRAMKIPQFGFGWSLGASVWTGGSSVSERWHPVGRG